MDQLCFAASKVDFDISTKVVYKPIFVKFSVLKDFI